MNHNNRGNNDLVEKAANSLNGVKEAIIHDWDVRWKVLVSVLFLIISGLIHSLIFFLMVLTASTLIVMAEMINTVIEMICDFIEPNHNRTIGRIKDMAAGVVAVAFSVWIVVLLFVLYTWIRQYVI